MNIACTCASRAEVWHTDSWNKAPASATGFCRKLSKSFSFIDILKGLYGLRWDFSNYPDKYSSLLISYLCFAYYFISLTLCFYFFPVLYLETDDNIFFLEPLTLLFSLCIFEDSNFLSLLENKKSHYQKKLCLPPPSPII